MYDVKVHTASLGHLISFVVPFPALSSLSPPGDRPYPQDETSRDDKGWFTPVEVEALRQKLQDLWPSARQMPQDASQDQQPQAADKERGGRGRGRTDSPAREGKVETIPLCWAPEAAAPPCSAPPWEEKALFLPQPFLALCAGPVRSLPYMVPNPSPPSPPQLRCCCAVPPPAQCLLLKRSDDRRLVSALPLARLDKASHGHSDAASLQVRFGQSLSPAPTDPRADPARGTSAAMRSNSREGRQCPAPSSWGGNMSAAAAAASS